MEYRKARPADFERIVALQNGNLRTALTPAEQAAGFLSTPFTSEEFRAMDASLAVVVCAEEDAILGYLCASQPECNRPALPRGARIARPAAMLEAASRICLAGKPLTSYRCCVANPVCVAGPFRGKGISMGLFLKMLELVSGRCELILTFSSVENRRSLRAIGRMGGEKVGRFEYEDEAFWILARFA